MNGMNVFFHLASALGACALVFLLLRAQRQRDFLRALMAGAAPDAGRPRRVVVETPGVFLGRFAEALGVPLDVGEDQALPPRRIMPEVLAELYLKVGLTLIRCGRSGDALRLELHVKAAGEHPSAAELARALGDGVEVAIVLPGGPSSGGD